MRIAIVDDCENERNELCKRLSQSSFSRSYNIEICGYGNGTDFLNEAMQNRFDLVFLFHIYVHKNKVKSFLNEAMQNRFDLVFMDIYMEKENGIDAAQKLRKFDKDCLLVFTTTSTDHALEGFRVRALHYLVKPYSDEELDMLLDEISQKISVEEKYIEIPSASDLLRIKLCDILYAEHFKHCIHIHCTDKSEKSVRSTFAEFVMLFDDGDNFFVCNRGIIVNLEHIRDMNGNEFVLDNGEKISISRSLVKSAKSTFGEYIFGRRDLH